MSEMSSISTQNENLNCYCPVCSFSIKLDYYFENVRVISGFSKEFRFYDLLNLENIALVYEKFGETIYILNINSKKIEISIKFNSTTPNILTLILGFNEIKLDSLKYFMDHMSEYIYTNIYYTQRNIYGQQLIEHGYIIEKDARGDFY